MTRKEAEAEARELNKREPQWFCPLINGLCNKACVNFMPAFVESREKRRASCSTMQKMTTFLWMAFPAPTQCLLGRAEARDRSRDL